MRLEDAEDIGDATRGLGQQRHRPEDVEHVPLRTLHPATPPLNTCNPIAFQPQQKARKVDNSKGLKPETLYA